MNRRQRAQGMSCTRANSEHTLLGEESARASYAERVSSLVDALPVLIGSFDSVGRCLFVNRGAAGLLKRGKLEPADLGSILEEASESKGSWGRVVQDTLQSEQDASLEVRLGSDASESIVVFLKSEVDREAPTSSRVVALGIASSVLRVLRQESFGEHHLAMIAHELRNPLSNVQSGMKILEMAPSEEVARNTRELIRRQLDFLAGLVSDLLEATRSNMGSWRLTQSQTDAHHIIQLALQLCGESAKAPGISVALPSLSENRPFNGDAHRLAQALSNLIDNAVKFTPSDGKILISASYNEHEVCIVVSDTGIGLTEEQRRALFRPFAQIEAARSWSPNGLGLGLFISKSIVEAHGGKIEVRSEGPHKGAAFSLRIPLTPKGY